MRHGDTDSDSTTQESSLVCRERQSWDFEKPRPTRVSSDENWSVETVDRGDRGLSPLTAEPNIFGRDGANRLDVTSAGRLVHGLSRGLPWNIVDSSP